MTENIIKIKDSNDKIVEVEILFTFKNNKNNKSYLVYTDHSKDSSGKEKVYASTFDETLKDKKLYELKDDNEYFIIEHILSSINKKENIGWKVWKKE